MKAPVNGMLFTRDDPVELFVNLPMPRVNAAVAEHFVMLFRDVLNQPLDKFHDGECFFHVGVILMAVIMKGNKIAVVAVNP